MYLYIFRVNVLYNFTNFSEINVNLLIEINKFFLCLKTFLTHEYCVIL